MAAKVNLSGPVPGHEWRGWRSAWRVARDGERELQFMSATDEAEKGTPPHLDPGEARLLAVCECGWLGDPEEWLPRTERRDSREFKQHVDLARTTVMWSESAAEVAAGALTLAADAWDGDPQFAAFLRARADHISDVGRFDGANWPEAD